MSKNKKVEIRKFNFCKPSFSKPNQRIYMNLLGPLKTIPSVKSSYCYHIEFWKYVELVAIPDKRKPKVCSALFSR
jgi:hypothetical protein